MKIYNENIQVNIPIYQGSVSASRLDELNQTLSAEKELSINSHSDQVNISEEAREKSVDDINQAAMRKIMGKEDVNKAEGEDQKALDEKIAELQEKITRLTAEIAQERRKGNNEKLKAMESELVMLNSQLLQLIEQQMEAAKSP